MTKKERLLVHYQQIFNAASHLGDLSNLDERAFAFSASLPCATRSAPSEPVQMELHQIRKSGPVSLGEDQPAMVWFDSPSLADDDIECKGLVIMPWDFMQSQTGSETERRSAVAWKTYLTLMLNKRLSGQGSISIEQYDLSDCLAGTLDQLRRQWANSLDDSPALQTLVAPPQSWGHPPATGGTLMGRFSNDPAQFFSSRYNHAFGERLSDIAALAGDVAPIQSAA